MARTIEIALSVTLLVALLPVIGLIALAVRLESRGPVLVRRGGLLAFRTETSGRSTGTGRLLQRTGLDVLPTLWNVLRGEAHLAALGG